ncbi:MAG: CoA-acylating methylmalonate-semialdehyde dehydrogenase [Actinomycetota bacterium]|nr:CoA-acylating methylmalonate-semialdehyde dehydrogenase [Actinomycetota bacterium]
MTDVVDAPAAVKPINHWIAGGRLAGRSGRSGRVYNPATGEQTGAVDFATVEEVDQAVQAAKAAFPAWRALSLAKRAELFFSIRELFHDRREEIARHLTAEHGKVLSDALGEVTRGLEVIEFCCGLPHLLKGGMTEQASTGIDVYSIRQPLGVVAGITPFNFPAMVPMWMWAPALACGNTFVLKPSEKDPSASSYTAELLQQAGVPDGVFNVVHGDKVAVDALLEHEDVSAISFVGSTPIAKYVYERATAKGKRCQALGGAKNHMIVLPDADIDMAADAAVSAAYGSAGERCMAVSLVVAVGEVADPLVKAIKQRIPNVKVGDGMDSSSEMGPLITREHRDKVASYIDAGAGEGATVVVDGREGVPAEGFFLAPSLIDRVTPEMKSYRDEIFGPVLGVTRVDTYDEAVTLVNENPYGNGTAIFTRDGGVARQFQFDVQAGMVGINVPVPVPVAYYSFGGWKASLFGDRHIYGPEGIDFYTRSKVVTSRWPDPATSKVDLGFPQTR